MQLTREELRAAIEALAQMEAEIQNGRPGAVRSKPEAVLSAKGKLLSALFGGDHA